jgi:uncharacterized protein (TIGR03382 family)
VKKTTQFAGVLVGALLLAPSAAAHIEIQWPVPRHDGDYQKDAPCGDEYSEPMKVYRYEPGRTITLQWREVVDHNSHYRIAFDPSGHDSFIEPQDENDLYNDPDIVLVDGIEDKDGGLFEYDITLPDMPCEDCTLQLIQVMKDDFGGTFSGNYFACVDFAMEGDSLDEPPPPPPPDDDDGDGDSDDGSDADAGQEGDGSPRGSGCGCGSTPTPSGVVFAVLTLAALSRRRTGS